MLKVSEGAASNFKQTLELLRAASLQLNTCCSPPTEAAEVDAVVDAAVDADEKDNQDNRDQNPMIVHGTRQDVI